MTEENARALRFGVCEDPLPAHRGMAGRLVVPLLDANGVAQSLKWRCLQDHDCKESGHPKYLGTEGASPLLFGVVNLLDDDADTLWITEGELDCAVLWKELGLCAIGYPGTGSWSSLFTRAVGPDWPRIVVVADGDEPGRQAAKKVAKELRGEVLNLPDGEDVASLYVSRGRSGLEQVLGLVEAEPEFDPYPDEPPF